MLLDAACRTFYFNVTLQITSIFGLTWLVFILVYMYDQFTLNKLHALRTLFPIEGAKFLKKGQLQGHLKQHNLE